MRYFLASFKATIDKKVCDFDTCFSCNGYPIRKNLVKSINENRGGIDEVKDIIFTNIIELSKEDYENWTRDIGE